jgi:hypothetical protein
METWKADPLSKAEADVLDERRRQAREEGWTPDHDDKHSSGQMAIAGGMYAINSADPMFLEFDSFGLREPYPIGWPWHRQWWKPKNPRRDLVRAAALLIAEIERLDRKAGRTMPR